MSTPPEVLIVAHSFLAPPRSPPRHLMLLVSTFTTRSWAQVQKFAHPAFTSLNSTSAAASITMLLPVPQASITPWENFMRSGAQPLATEFLMWMLVLLALHD